MAQVKNDLGTVVLTKNQKSRMYTLHDANVKGIVVKGNDEAFAFSDIAMTAGEISTLVAALLALPDSLDPDTTLATTTQIQTAYDLKGSDPDRIAFLIGLQKLVIDNTYTVTNVNAL